MEEYAKKAYEEEVPTTLQYTYRENLPVSDNKIRPLEIREVNRGYIVGAGCHTFAISTKEELTDLITRYVNEPAKVEEQWFKGELF